MLPKSDLHDEGRRRITKKVVLHDQGERGGPDTSKIYILIFTPSVQMHPNII